VSCDRGQWRLWQAGKPVLRAFTVYRLTG
jgi:hypothetical protein